MIIEGIYNEFRKNLFGIYGQGHVSSMLLGFIGYLARVSWRLWQQWENLKHSLPSFSQSHLQTVSNKTFPHFSISNVLILFYFFIFFRIPL